MSYVINCVYLFQKISLPQNVTDQYKRYGLYAYGEGRLIEKIRGMEFSGLPVLFIPGHSGSHKQGKEQFLMHKKI